MGRARRLYPTPEEIQPIDSYTIPADQFFYHVTGTPMAKSGCILPCLIICILHFILRNPAGPLQFGTSCAVIVTTGAEESNRGPMRMTSVTNAAWMQNVVFSIPGFWKCPPTIFSRTNQKKRASKHWPYEKNSKKKLAPQQ